MINFHGTRRGSIALLFRDFLTGTEETHEKPNKYNQVPAYILISQLLSTNKVFIKTPTHSL
jgi:hypothetical protein